MTDVAPTDPSSAPVVDAPIETAPVDPIVTPDPVVADPVTDLATSVVPITPTAATTPDECRAEAVRLLQLAEERGANFDQLIQMAGLYVSLANDISGPTTA